MLRRAAGIHRGVLLIERARTIAAAQVILDQGGWCLLEACVDVPGQCWEARILIFNLAAEAVADAVFEEIEYAPELDYRLTGCDRSALRPNPAMGAHLCYLADVPAASGAPVGGLGGDERDEGVDRRPARPDIGAEHEPGSRGRSVDQVNLSQPARAEFGLDRRS